MSRYRWLTRIEALFRKAFSWLILRMIEDCVSGASKDVSGHLFKAPGTRAALLATVPRIRHLSKGLAKVQVGLSEPE